MDVCRQSHRHEEKGKGTIHRFELGLISVFMAFLEPDYPAHAWYEPGFEPGFNSIYDVFDVFYDVFLSVFFCVFFTGINRNCKFRLIPVNSG